MGCVWERNDQLEVFLEEVLSINSKDINKLVLKFTEWFMAALFDPVSSGTLDFSVLFILAVTYGNNVIAR